MLSLYGRSLPWHPHDRPYRKKHTPKFVPPRWGRLPFDPTQTGLCKFGWVWSSKGTVPTLCQDGAHTQQWDTLQRRASLKGDWHRMLEMIFLVMSPFTLPSQISGKKEACPANASAIYSSLSGSKRPKSLERAKKRVSRALRPWNPPSFSGPISRDIATLSLRYSILHGAFSGRLALPQNGPIPPLDTQFRKRRVCAIPHFATYRAIIVR